MTYRFNFPLFYFITAMSEKITSQIDFEKMMSESYFKSKKTGRKKNKN